MPYVTQEGGNAVFFHLTHFVEVADSHRDERKLFLYHNSISNAFSLDSTGTCARFAIA